MHRRYWHPDLVKLLDKYYRTKDSKDFKNLLRWLGVPWMSYELLYEVYSEIKALDSARSADEHLDLRLELRLKITELMLAGAWRDKYDRNMLCSLYEIAKNEGKEAEVLEVIGRRAAIGHEYYDSQTWLLFWAYYPVSKLAELAERKLIELGKPIKPMTEEEKALESIQIILGSCAA